MPSNLVTLLVSQASSLLKDLAKLNVEPMSVTELVSQLGSELKASADLKMPYMFVTLLVSQLSGSLNVVLDRKTFDRSSTRDTSQPEMDPCVLSDAGKLSTCTCSAAFVVKTPGSGGVGGGCAGGDGVTTRGKVPASSQHRFSTVRSLPLP